MSLLIAATTFYSCDKEESSDNITFQFDDDGLPYRDSPSTPLSSEMQSLIKDVVIGNGWMWKSTREISKDGSLIGKGYWKDRVGASPSEYFFDSDTLLTDYFYCDACEGADVYSKTKISIDYSTGFVKTDYDVMLGIWSVFEEKGVWHMKIVDNLGCRLTDEGECVTTWGCSEYVMMNESQLKKVQNEYVDITTIDY